MDGLKTGIVRWVRLGRVWPGLVVILLLLTLMVPASTPASAEACNPRLECWMEGGKVYWRALGLNQPHWWKVAWSGSLGSDETIFQVTKDWTLMHEGCYMNEGSFVHTVGSYSVELFLRTGQGQGQKWHLRGSCSGEALAADFAATPACSGVVQFTNSTTGGTPPYTYAWSFGDGGTSTAVDPSHTFASAGPHSVTLTVTDSATPTANTHSVTKSVTAWIDPTVSIVADPESAELSCTDTVVYLSVQEPNSGYTYTWYKGTVDTENRAGDGATLPVTEAGTYLVVATGIATGCESEPASVDVTGGCQPAPGLSISKTVDLATATVGDVVQFTLRITNTGEGDLTNVKLSDALLGLNNVTVGSGTITPGNYWEDSYPYTVTAADVEAGYVVNTATATADDVNPASDTAVVTVLRPGLNITKTADRATAKAGETVRYTIVVANNGTAGLSGVTVDDDKLGVHVSIGDLEAGDDWSNTYEYVVTAADAATGEVVNTAIADSDQTEPVSASCVVSIGTPPPPTPPPPPPPAPPCTRADVSAIIHGGWDGIAVNASVGGTGQPTKHTATDSFGRAAVLWTFYPPAGATWTVTVTPQLPPGLDPERWTFEPASASASIRRCGEAQLTFQLIDRGEKEPEPAVILPVTGGGAAGAGWWQGLVRWLRGFLGPVA